MAGGRGVPGSRHGLAILGPTGIGRQAGRSDPWGGAIWERPCGHPWDGVAGPLGKAYVSYYLCRCRLAVG